MDSIIGKQIEWFAQYLFSLKIAASVQSLHE